MMSENFAERLAALPGKISVFYKNLVSGEVFDYHAGVQHIAASVIKLPSLVAAFEAMQEDTLTPDEVFAIRPEQKMPSCGALTYMHDGLEVTALDLCTLMIIVSDNTATNILIDRLGIDAVNASIAAHGLEDTVLRRKLFDSEQSKRGIQNIITAADIALLLEQLYHHTCVDETKDEQMLRILKSQRLNGKIPFFINALPIAHKTGEDSGITHDVGIVYAREPFVVCFAGSETDVPQFERLMQDMAREMTNG